MNDLSLCDIEITFIKSSKAGMLGPGLVLRPENGDLDRTGVGLGPGHDLRLPTPSDFSTASRR